MFEEKEQGLYLIYSLIHYNFFLNIMFTCTINFPNEHCEQFEDKAQKIIKSEMALIEEKYKQNKQGQEDLQSLFNLNNIFEKLFDL